MTQPEQPEPLPYLHAARFRRERRAGRAYFQLQETIERESCDLSTYRFLLSEIWHVAVLGQTPPETLDRTIRRILATGEPTPLPDDILQQLCQRRAQAIRLGPWVERHWHPE